MAVIDKINIDDIEYKIHNTVEYSTEAIDTGCRWIDGKIIWRKVLKAQFGKYNSTEFFPINDTVKEFISSNIIVKYGLEEGTYYLEKIGYSNQYNHLYMIGSYRNNDAPDNKNTIHIRCANDSFVNQPIIIILEYTRV